MDRPPRYSDAVSSNGVLVGILRLFGVYGLLTESQQDPWFCLAEYWLRSVRQAVSEVRRSSTIRSEVGEGEYAGLSDLEGLRAGKQKTEALAFRV